MKIINTKTITILIIGILALTATVVFAGNYNSSLSNKSTAIVNQEIGDILLRYGAGGAEINKVTDSLAVGISKVELEATLIEIGIGEEGVNEIFTKLDDLETGFIKADDQEKAISTIDAGGTTQTVGEIEIALEKIERGEISTSDLSDTKTISSSGFKSVDGLDSATKIIKIKESDDTTTRRKPTYTNIILERAVFQDASKDIIQNISSAAPEERKILIDELKINRGTFQTEIVSMSLSIRENAKELRDNFRENVKSGAAKPELCKAVCTGRVANAHGKGLRMLNRFRSATARFEHVLKRIESRVEKLEARGNYQVDSFFDVFTSIEGAKNISVENEAKLEELKATYELLLLGENPQGVAEEARAIAEELKSDIQILHTKLRDIVDEIKRAVDYNSSISNTST